LFVPRDLVPEKDEKPGGGRLGDQEAACFSAIENDALSGAGRDLVTFLRDVDRSMLHELNNDVVIFRTKMDRVANNADGTCCDLRNAHRAGPPQIQRGAKRPRRKQLDIAAEDMPVQLVAKSGQPIVLGEFGSIQIDPLGTTNPGSFIAWRWTIAIV
jgi:hypothetical protein